ncbi:bifunctional non-homologous end joining protein LigD [Scopulibacillus daqui]|uniref:Bifunctional non-homologous end joining protein LigD n=1 Tax=Scopulibacillus daqui TaxID=1469162 RepID=A0ABS2PVB6_9BACL|nr:non-homologous end-joining DNA ligase [Scopulibacillus daqui]MBM7643982.1 bifunctional non-homologous end joining protein LigD [Scopulibacillus daqui]
MGNNTDRHAVSVDGEQVTLTSLSKPLWPDKGLTKADYLNYLTRMAPFMLPFLKNRALTVIRYPHGAGGESFFQKNCPDYVPDFVKTKIIDDINYIVCSDLPTLIWLGNQLAFELHVPFQTIDTDKPAEIVLDLDPPSRDAFQLAVTAALLIKEITDKLHLTSFVKTSGNKGLQVYIPLPDNRYTYEETRLFTSFAAEFLKEKEPKLFTTERLKKKRGNKLYIDVVQHAEGKTIIAPYSVRGNQEALVAAPLFWDEVNSSLRPEHYPLDLIEKRLQTKGDPFSTFHKAKHKQSFEPIVTWLKERQKKG